MSGFFSRITDFFEKRAQSNSPYDPLWSSFGLFSLSKSGQTITTDAAMRTTAVYACIRVLAESIASLPCMIYSRRKDGGKDTAGTFYLYPLLHDSPNPYQTSFEFRELMVTHLCLRGNFYAKKDINGAGHIIALTPLDPDKVVITKKADKLSYSYTWEDGKQQEFSEADIWHVKGLSKDGIIGLSPIALARESIGLSLALEEHGARLFSNYAKPGGILEHPGKLSEDAAKRLKASWQAAHSGGESAHKVAVLEEGLKWTSIGFSNEDSQFLESRAFQISDIARIFRVPTVLIGHPDKNSTYASAEQFFLSFVVHTIRPWLVRIEQSANKSLLTESDRKKYFVEFKIDGLLRGDIKSRYEAFAIGRQNKWLNANEIRAMENLNPIDGGDIYENPNITIGDSKNAIPK